MEGLIPSQVKLPEIQSGSVSKVTTEQDALDWLLVQRGEAEERLLLQEKMDGSNFTVYRPSEAHALLFLNKGKPVDEAGSQFSRTCKVLRNRADLFLPGYIYHGESMRTARPNFIHYQRIPRYHWVCYEILKAGSFTCATPEEMQAILRDTGIEQAPIYFDTDYDGMDAVKLLGIFQQLDTLPSSLGNVAEGFVLKVPTRVKKNLVMPMRRKYVATHMRERKVPQGMISPDCTIEAIGDVWNVPARHRKAQQHLEERGEKVTLQSLYAEADADLEKEHKEEILDLLWERYWSIIRKAARADLAKNLGLQE